MKKIIFVLLFVLPEILWAQNNQNIPLEPSLLWKVSANGLEHPSYLFGTIHLIPAKEYFLPAGTKNALKNCQQLALEVDINIAVKEQIRLAQKALLPNGKTVKDYLNQQEYSRFKTFLLDSLEVDKKKYKRYIRFKPMYIYSLLLSEQLGSIKNYEKELNKIAKRNKLHVVGLETIEFQMNLIDSFPIKEQALSLLDSQMKSQYMQMLEIYKQQNLSKLFELTTQDPQFKDIESPFLSERNNRWLPKIENMMKKKPVFIAVGAAHLAGNQGLINQLRQKGYLVEPVK